MLLAIFVVLCVVGVLFLLPVVLVVALFFLNKNKVMHPGFGDDFRTVFSKILNDIHSRAHYQSTSSGTRDGLSHGEALEILGLDHTANREQIISAYHRLMKHAHPDKGGSAYFAQKLNQARDRLLGNKK